jgi:hypothetical protein
MGRIDARLLRHVRHFFLVKEGVESLDSRQRKLALPDDTRLWTALQEASGGTSAGAVYDVDRITARLDAGRRARRQHTRNPLKPQSEILYVFAISALIGRAAFSRR